MERALEVFALVQFIIVGLSHIFQPKAWVDFFSQLRERGHAGVFVHGFLSLFFGSLVVGFHNVWSGPAMVLTIVGYLYTLKAFMCLVFPQTQMRTLGRVSYERSHELVVVGVVYLGLAGVVGWSLWRHVWF